LTAPEKIAIEEFFPGLKKKNTKNERHGKTSNIKKIPTLPAFFQTMTQLALRSN